MKITIADFKRLVVDDYKTIVRSRRLVTEMHSDNRDDIILNCDLAQIVLSKFIGEKDIFISSKINIAYNLAKGKPEMAKNLMSYTDIFAEVNNIDVPNIIVYATSDISFDFAYQIIRKKLPLLYVIYNVGNAETTASNSDILKMLGGFTSLYKERVSTVSIRGGDYASLFGTLEKQIDYTRRYRCPSIAIIDKCEDCIGEFSDWITEKGLAEEDELNAYYQQQLK
ncbi:MAG: hypothetical protein MJZ15_06040 [Bacteroidales bacterium]|nr:hypothetical protein [Bacteroidales bacterium]